MNTMSLTYPLRSNNYQRLKSSGYGNKTPYEITETAR